MTKFEKGTGHWLSVFIKTNSLTRLNVQQQRAHDAYRPLAQA